MSFLDDYQPVEERLEKFWADHPTGRILTVLAHHTDGDYIFRAEVWKTRPKDDGLDSAPDSTGWAHDSTSQLPANMKASALEVCETSAIGRALANLGYAPKGARPSREEMSKSVSPAPLAGPKTEAGKSPPTQAAGTDNGVTGGAAPVVPAEASVAGDSQSDSASPGPESEDVPAGSKGSGEPRPRGCVHQNTTEYKPDGETKLAEGRVRCIDCGLTLVMVP